MIFIPLKMNEISKPTQISTISLAPRADGGEIESTIGCTRTASPGAPAWGLILFRNTETLFLQGGSYTIDAITHSALRPSVHTGVLVSIFCQSASHLLQNGHYKV